MGADGLLNGREDDMVTMTHTRIKRILVAFGLSLSIAVPGFGQDATDNQPRPIAITAGFDLLNQYVFRGVRQNSTALVVWPSVDVILTPLSRDGALEKVMVDVGYWNSLNSGDTGSGGPIGDVWYESRYHATLGLAFARGVSVGTTYTVYTSPNEMFTTVEELAVRLDLDDRPILGRAALSPYALVAFELDAHPGSGQLDGGLHAGRYLELGVSPGYAARHAGLAVPIKIGLSLSNYYELAGRDNAFGFGSVGGIVTVPLHTARNRGALHVHGGAHFQLYGETTKVFNGGDRHKVIGLVGIGLSY